MKFDAFISYRHVPRDIAVAENLHKMLEQYRVPKSVRKLTGKKKIHRVFRDRDELPLSNNLSDNLLTALDQSEYLLVICSPESKESMWVQREVEYFIKTHDREHVLAILTSGEPEEAFPDLILHAEKEVVTEDGETVTIIEDVEPLAADVRAHSVEESIKILKKEKLRVLAALLGCEYNDLKQRHKEAMMKRAFALSSMVITLLTAFSIYAYRQNVMITKEYTEKQISQARNLARYSQENLLEGDRDTAILLALEALPASSEDKEKPVVPEAVNALTEAVYAYQTPKNQLYRSKHMVSTMGNTMNFGKNACQISPKGSCFSIFDNSEIVQIYGMDDGQLMYQYEMSDFSLTPMEEVRNKEILQFVTFLSEEELLMVSTQHIFAVNMNNGSVLWETLLPQNNPHSEDMLRNNCVEISEDRQFLWAYYFQHCFVFDIVNHKFLLDVNLIQENDTSVSEMDAILSPDGSKLILSSRDDLYTGNKKMVDNVRVIDIKTGAIEYLPIKSSAAITATFLSDGRLLLMTSSEIPTVQLDNICHVNYQLLVYDFASEKSEIIYSGENGYQNKIKPEFLSQEVTLEDGKKEKRIAGFIGNQLFIINEEGKICSQILTEATITNLQHFTENKIVVGLSNGTVARYNLLWDSKMPLKYMISVKNYDMAYVYYQQDRDLILQIPKSGNKCIINSPLYDENYRALPIKGEIGKTGYLCLNDDPEKNYRLATNEDQLMVWSLGKSPEEECIVADIKSRNGGQLNLEILFENQEGHRILCYSESYSTADGKKMQSLEAMDLEEESILWSYELELNRPEIYSQYNVPYLFWVAGSKISLIDKETGEEREIQREKVFLSSEENMYTYSIDFSADGKYAIWIAGTVSDEKTVYRYDIENDSWDIFPGLESVENYINKAVVARKSNLLAYCKEGTFIDIYDIDSMEIIQQIPIRGQTTSIYSFMDNEKYLIYQSDDKIFRSVNIETKEIVMEDTEVYYGVGQIYSMDNSKILRISASPKSDQELNTFWKQAIYLFWMDEDGSFSLYTQIPDGFASIVANEVVVLNPDQDTSLGIYPFYDLDQLIERARNIVGDRKLSQTERVRYFIENH